ncbi:MAG: polyphenol oxidase family protein [Gemmatimonadetes bacterium]|nr:polyphenol oxidase family protein [Gemmatimonadota bacterium]
MTLVKSAQVVLEVLVEGDTPLWRHPDWADRFPWLVHGTTGVGRKDDPFDLGLFGDQPVGAAMGRWRRLIAHTGLPAAVHARQVHGGELLLHEQAQWSGLLVADGVDGHVTLDPGVLLTVSIADCVPVALVDSEGRGVALVHAGWRGVAAGIVENACRTLQMKGARVGDLYAHSGPSICGDCYEVGVEVHRAVNPHLDAPDRPTPIDLRSALSERLVAAGLPFANVTVSGHCTRCGPGEFFSHRRGSPARQMSILGRRR